MFICDKIFFLNTIIYHYIIVFLIYICNTLKYYFKYYFIFNNKKSFQYAKILPIIDVDKSKIIKSTNRYNDCCVIKFHNTGN